MISLIEENWEENEGSGNLLRLNYLWWLKMTYSHQLGQLSFLPISSIEFGLWTPRIFTSDHKMWNTFQLTYNPKVSELLEFI